MEFIYHILVLISIYGVLTLTNNLIIGYLGILYLGHPATYGIGAYAFAYLVMNGTPFPLAILAAGLASTAAGILLALPALRLKSHYIGMTTLGFLIIMNNVFLNAKGITRGALGIPGIPRPTVFGNYLDTNLEFLLFAAPICALSLFIIHKALSAPFGRVIETIREDETAAKTIGKNTIKYKIQAFALTGFFGGIGGALLASYIQYINPWNFSLDELILVLAMVIVGGMGSFWGSILGASIIIIIPEALKFLSLPPEIIAELRLGIYGLMIILFMIFRPNGLLGKITKSFQK